MIRRPSPASAVVFVAGVAVLFVSGGAALQLLLGEGGLVAAEWLLLFLPAVVFVRAGGFDVRESLFLAAPGRLALVGGVLMVLGATPVAWGIGWLQTFVIPVPPRVVEAMQQFVTAESPGRLAWLLLALALTPAICEEVVFRGVLLSATRELETWRALLLNGVVFGAFHLSFETPVRFLPTAWMGIVLAWAVLRSGSLWTGVLMHLLNNGAIVLLASVPAWSGAITEPDTPPPAWLLAVAVLALVAGGWILAVEPASASPPHESTSEAP